MDMDEPTIRDRLIRAPRQLATKVGSDAPADPSSSLLPVLAANSGAIYAALRPQGPKARSALQHFAGGGCLFRRCCNPSEVRYRIAFHRPQQEKHSLLFVEYREKLHDRVPACSCGVGGAAGRHRRAVRFLRSAPVKSGRISLSEPSRFSEEWQVAKTPLKPRQHTPGFRRCETQMRKPGPDTVPRARRMQSDRLPARVGYQMPLSQDAEGPRDVNLDARHPALPVPLRKFPSSTFWITSFLRAGLSASKARGIRIYCL